MIHAIDRLRTDRNQAAGAIPPHLLRTRDTLPAPRENTVVLDLTLSAVCGLSLVMFLRGRWKTGLALAAASTAGRILRRH